MRFETEDVIFGVGVVIVVGLVVTHYDPTAVAGLVGGHKLISVADGKFRDKIEDPPVQPPPDV